jgi:hypothetical protein
MGDTVDKLISKNVPAPLQSIAKQAAPELQNLAKKAVPSLQSLMPGSSGRIDPAAEATSLGMSLDQYNNLSTEELNRLKGGSSSGGFFDSIGNFFKDDPNSGWYDTMKKNSADDDLVKQAMAGLGDQVKAQSVTGNASSSPSFLDNIGSTFGSALKKVATPAGLETLGGIAGGLGSMYLTNQGTKEATAAYDQALADIKNRQDISGEAFNAVADSPEQLAMRAQALKGLSDRASMGLTPEDQAALQGINRQAAQQFKANQATIGQDMARRGMANSGLGLAQSMGAADQALQNQALAGQNQAAQSFAAKQGALSNLAGQSNTALQSDYARQMGKATNLSAVNQFNAQQKAQSAANAAQIQQQKAAAAQAAGTAKGQGVLDITKGAIGTLGK